MAKNIILHEDQINEIEKNIKEKLKEINEVFGRIDANKAIIVEKWKGQSAVAAASAIAAQKKNLADAAEAMNEATKTVKSTSKSILDADITVRSQFNKIIN